MGSSSSISLWLGDLMDANKELDINGEECWKVCPGCGAYYIRHCISRSCRYGIYSEMVKEELDDQDLKGS